MSVTLDGLSFQLADFTGTNHTSLMPESTIGASGYDYSGMVMFPDAVMTAMRQQQAVGFAPDSVAVTDTTKTLALSDANSLQACSNASTQTITVPLNSAVAFDIGGPIYFEKRGAGNVIIQGASGVTLNGTDGGSVTLGETSASGYIRKIATDSWIAAGLFHNSEEIVSGSYDGVTYTITGLPALFAQTVLHAEVFT